MNERVIINDRELEKHDIEHLKLALDIYQRLMMGQFSQVAQHLRIAMDGTIDLIRLEKIKDRFQECQDLIHKNNPKGWSIFGSEVNLSACYASKIEQLLLKNFPVADEMQRYIEERDREATMGELS